MKKLYHKVLECAARPEAPYVLFIIAFLESSVFPIPPDVLLIPMILASFDKAFRYAAICTIGSLLGGMAGYGIGYFGFETVGQPIIDFYGIQEHFNHTKTLYDAHGMVIVGVAGFSPIPYKIFTIFSGFMQANFAQFVVASGLSRGARFFLIAVLLWKGGERFKDWIEKNFYILTIVGSVIIAGLLFWLKIVME